MTDWLEGFMHGVSVGLALMALIVTALILSGVLL